MSSYDMVMEERKKLVSEIISNMKQGYVLPKPDWDKGMFPDTRIRNPVSGVKYHGSNMIRLYITGLKRGYNDGRWMTYKQAKAEGWQVRKGEQGVRCEKYIFEKFVEKENEETGELEKVKVRLNKPMVNTFVVFNAEQIEGIPKEKTGAVKALEPDEVLEMADRFQKSSECPIMETDEGKAYYSPKNDRIILPDRNAFIDSKAFLGTQLHEMVHSTGHPERLDRAIINQFGTPEYAMEELRAELGAFFIENDLNIQLDAQHFNSHTHYIESWIKALEDDPNELFRAIADAQKASDFLEERYEIVLEKEQAEERAYNINLSKQEVAAVRMAVKHEMKVPGTGKEYLDKFIDKQTLKRKELKLPEISEQMDMMYKKYDRLEVIQKVGELESQLNIPYNMKLTRWFGDYHMYEAVENLSDIDTQLQERLELLSTKSMDEVKDLLYRKEWAAASELKGYQWTHYDDGSGSLKDAADKKIAGYDLYTREVRFGDEWKNFSYENGFDLEFVKEYVEEKQVDVLSKEINSMEQPLENDVLFCVKQYDESSYYNMGKVSLDELMQQFRQVERPFIDMKGERVTAIKFAELEQSNKVSMSVTADIDANELTIYRINGIAENDRTDINTSISTQQLYEGKQVDVLSKEIREADLMPDGIDEARLNEIAEEMMLEEQAFMNGPELEI